MYFCIHKTALPPSSLYVNDKWVLLVISFQLHLLLDDNFIPNPDCSMLGISSSLVFFPTTQCSPRTLAISGPSSGTRHNNSLLHVLASDGAVAFLYGAHHNSNRTRAWRQRGSSLQVLAGDGTIASSYGARHNSRRA